MSNEGNDADSGGKRTPFRPFLPSRTASFPSFNRKNYGSDPSETDIKVVIPAPTQKKHKQKIKEISIQGRRTRIKPKKNLEYGKKFKKLTESCLHAASIKSTVGNELGFFPSPFHISTSSCLTSAGAFRGDYVAACSTAFRSATEENDSGSYVDVTCPYKVKQRSITADWLKF